MAVVVSAPPALSGELGLYHTTDPLLANSPVLAYHGPSATIGATSSRIQVHIFTPAGCGSYSRLAISPTSPYWSAVSNLPREEQGDEVCRGIAFGLKKYFAELSEDIKKAWAAQAKAPAPGALFGDNHIAVLATRMTRIENIGQVTADLKRCFCEQRLSWIDVDFALPPGTINPPLERSDSPSQTELEDEQLLKQQYGRYSELVSSLGEPTFLPTSKLKRAPSKASMIGRSASFLRHQKENVRKELTELLSTEISYVERVSELLALSRSLGPDLSAAKKQQLLEIFPSGLEGITGINAAFCETLRMIVEGTEQAALEEIEASPDHPDAAHARRNAMSGIEGLDAVAKCFCEWFPQFASCYAAYLETQATCAQQLRSLLRGTDTALAPLLGEIGEQKLTSLLIEPVQRLPRYSLYIDNIARQLPIRHSALKQLMKARDIISDICSQAGSDAGADLDQLLRSRISGWQSGAETTNRLVTVVDVVELLPPYDSESCKSINMLLLLSTNGLVIVEKTSNSALSARALMTEVESGKAIIPSVETRPTTPGGLRFVRRFHLDEFRCSEGQNGQTIHFTTQTELLSIADSQLQPSGATFAQTWLLEGGYEGKASRFLNELSKVKIEGRFSETERESTKWAVFGTNLLSDAVGVLAAVFEDSNSEYFRMRRSFACNRVVVDLDRHSHRPRAGQQGIRNVIAVSPVQDGLWRVSVDSLDGTFEREPLATVDVIASIRKKLSILIAVQFGMNAATTAHAIGMNETMLRSLDLQALSNASDASQRPVSIEPRQHRPKSPVKMLSSLLSTSASEGRQPAVLRKGSSDLPSLGHTPRLQPNSQQNPKPSSREGRPPSRDLGTPRSMSFMASSEELVNSNQRLENSLNTYILALQARKGNIVGKSLKNRFSAEEREVNDVYNALLEDSNMMVTAAQATVDVLFAAFEKFLNVAWKEQNGQIVPIDILRDIQAQAEKLVPVDLDDYVKVRIGELTVQNQRAFKAIMQLLADLLDGTGNDGDRGVLTAAFAEALVTEGNPRDYIGLIDRFVEDTDTYFGEPLDEAIRATDGTLLGHKRSRSAHTGSLTSNTSSLRKKFGLSRENSKSDHDSKMTSVWRTLSKSKGDASPASSISKATFSTLHRSHSTENANLFPKRPTSQDGSSNKAPAFESHAASSQTNGLSTIGEHPSFIPTGPPKKKRRSSLSDLRSMQKDAAQQMPRPLFSPPAERDRRAPLFYRALEEKALPASPTPTTPSSKNSSGRFGSAMKDPPRLRLPASFRKEDPPGQPQTLAVGSPPRPKTGGSTDDQRSKVTSSSTEEVVITTKPTSNIPTLKPRSVRAQTTSSPPREGLQERVDGGNAVRRASPSHEKTNKPWRPASTAVTTPSPKKLRMQSPQKLRERLQNEQSSISAAQSTIQDELNKIGEELTATPSRIASIRSGAAPNRVRGSGQPSNVDLAARVLKLEGQLPRQFDDFNSRINTIQTDLASSLSVSENKNRKLDELYREANAENEALYNRFNEELSRIIARVKAGEGVDELKKQLKESQEEAIKLRRETSRLKRENVGLRAQLKE